MTEENKSLKGDLNKISKDTESTIDGATDNLAAEYF